MLVSSPRRRVRDLKDTMVRLFGDHCDSGLFTMKFHILEHLFEDYGEFHKLQFFAVAPYGHFNVVLERSYRRFYDKSD